jgi:hypothetical protein
MVSKERQIQRIGMIKIDSCTLSKSQVRQVVVIGIERQDLYITRTDSVEEC